MATLTKDQINLFTQKAKSAGLSDFQISAEIKKKEQELSGGTGDYTSAPKSSASSVSVPAQSNTSSTSSMQAPVNTNIPADAPQEQPSFISGFIKSLTDPAVNYLKFVGEGGYQIGRVVFDADFRKLALGQDVSEEAAQRIANEDLTMFLKPEQIATTKDIIKTGAKATAGAASYVIPFGKGANIATKALLPGFTSAALAETSREGSTPSSVIEQGVVGAATAGALEGVAGVASWVKDKSGLLKRTSKDIAEGTRKIKTQASIFGAEKEKAINETLDRYGFSGTAQAQYENLAPTMQKIEGQISEFIKNNPEITVSTKDLKKSFLDNVQSSLRTKDLTRKEATTEIQGYLDDLVKASGGVFGKGFTFKEGENIGLASLRDMKKILNQDYGGVYAKLEKGTALNAREKVIAAAWSSLDDAIKNVAPEVKSLLIDESNLYQAAKPLSSARNNPPVLRAFGTSIPAGVTEWFRGMGSKTLKKLGIAAEKIPEGEIPTTLVKLAALTPAAMQERGLTPEEVSQVQDFTSSLQSDASMNSGQPGVETAITSPFDQQNQAGGDPSANNDFASTPSPMNPFGNLTKRQVMSLALASGASPSDLKDLGEIYDLVGAGETGIVSEEMQKTATSLRTEYFKRSDENNWSDALNSYKKVQSVSDTPQGDVSLIFAFMKMLDPQSVVREGEFATAEKTAGIPAQIVQQYNKALKGDRLSPEQRSAYKAEAGRVFAVYQERQAPIDAYYQGLAQRYGIDPTLVGVGLYR